jgi:hypothetical protein
MPVVWLSTDNRAAMKGGGILSILVAVVGLFLVLMAARQTAIAREYWRLGDMLLAVVLAVAGLGCFALAAG